jgi:sec-independent protein translocase protein TatA
MAGLGTLELVIILVVVLLVFGVGRIGKLGSELGKGISSFREGIKEGQNNDDPVATDSETEKKEA